MRQCIYWPEWVPNYLILARSAKAAYIMNQEDVVSVSLISVFHMLIFILLTIIDLAFSLNQLKQL